VVGLFAVSACDGGFQMPDFRGDQAAGPGALDTAPIDTPTIQPTAKERLVASLEGQGCVLNQTNVATVLTNASINQDELVQLVSELKAEGRVQSEGDSAVRLMSGNCV
jgi:hypothetical protein